MPLVIESSGNFASGFAFGESINRAEGTVKMPDFILTRLRLSGIMTVEDLLLLAQDDPTKLASIMSWPVTYIRDAVSHMLPGLKGLVEERYLKVPTLLPVQCKLL